MPADFEKCVNDGGRVRTMKMKDGKYMHVCYDKSGKSHAGEVKKKKESLTWVSNFLMEKIEPTLDENGKAILQEGSLDKVKIKGTLLRRESRNGRDYDLDGIIKAGNLATLPMPISMNHTEDVTDNVGKITKLFPAADGLDYEGYAYNTAKHPGTISMMENGLIDKISIEADNPVFEPKGDKVIVKEFQLMGAGFVKYAGIPQASASIAEALENKVEEDIMEAEELLKQLQEKDKALDEAKKTIDALKEEKSKAIIEETNKLKESIETLQTEVKSLKENKKSGVITDINEGSKYTFLESVPKGKQIETLQNMKNSFVLQNCGKDGLKEFFPLTPAEFY